MDDVPHAPPTSAGLNQLNGLQLVSQIIYVCKNNVFVLNITLAVAEVIQNLNNYLNFKLNIDGLLMQLALMSLARPKNKRK